MCMRCLPRLERRLVFTATLGFDRLSFVRNSNGREFPANLTLNLIGCVDQVISRSEFQMAGVQQWLRQRLICDGEPAHLFSHRADSGCPKRGSCGLAPAMMVYSSL